MKTKIKISLGLLTALLAFYIIQVNSLTREKYLLADHQKKIVQFSRANEVLEIDFSRSNSLANVDKYLSRQTFEKAKDVRYIQILAGEVVVR